MQQARNLAADLGLRMESLRFLLRDRDGKYGQCFDAVFEAEEMQILKSAPQAPRMNAHCERVIGTIRREVLDHVLIVNEAHARQVLATYQWHYNEHRPIGPATNYLRAPTSSPSPYTSSKAADSCGPASSAASSTSTAIRLDLQRRLSEPHRAFAWVDDEVTRRDLELGPRPPQRARVSALDPPGHRTDGGGLRGARRAGPRPRRRHARWQPVRARGTLWLWTGTAKARHRRTQTPRYSSI